MRSNYPAERKIASSDFARQPIRAIVELIDGELKIFPISDCEADEQAILDALCFVREVKNEKIPWPKPRDLYT